MAIVSLLFNAGEKRIEMNNHNSAVFLFVAASMCDAVRHLRFVLCLCAATINPQCQCKSVLLNPSPGDNSEDTFIVA